ncbi:sensor histidine kinase [Gelidibacter salicanalis]|uniref:histidine kinase n=1 Tax=Gelidibacter salicanalis TaxID=291193 RepID=A0A934NIE5_9FLAO|nr:HAMP domain-containing sensor histidine kinase [Gelidibacter salicanalis]MBJ7882016.1 HAMP domain-containing histidine kinase [Gelidibacter salicanalis]
MFYKDKYLALTVKIISLAIIIVVVIFFFYKIYQGENTYSQILDDKFKSEKIINEIRQNSEDLTRLARLYTNTKDTLYKNQYFEILNISKGVSPRPENFNRVYWGILTTKEQQDPPFIKTIKKSGSQLIATAKLDTLEKERISNALNYSLLLTQLEIEALHVLEEAPTSLNTLEAVPNQTKAIDLVNSEDYHKRVILIMKELNKAYALLETRTTKELSTLESEIKKSIIIISVLLFIIILTIVVIIQSALQLKKGTIDQLQISVQNKTKKLNESLMINREITKDLQTLNISKDLFFSIIAHDLKGPFNSLIGFSTLLLDDPVVNEHEELKESVQIIKSSSQNTFELLQNLLNWAQIQKGNLPFTRENLKIDDIVNNVLKVLSYQSMHKNIEIKTIIPDGPILVYADKDMLSTILRNLISNAIKYSHKNGTIEIICEKTTNAVNIIISDTGIGIPEERIKKLFDFQYVQKTRGTQGEKGTGLGLILTKDFIQRHHGAIWVESELGKGSKFTFTLPDF